MPDIHELTGIASIALSMLHRVEQLGLDREELVGIVGFTQNELEDSDARVPVTKIVELWRQVIERVPDPELGVRLGSEIKGPEMGIVGYAMHYSSTLGEALNRISRYCQIVSEAIQCTVERRDAGVAVVLDAHPMLDALRHPIGARLSGVLSTMREITDREIVPVEVLFPSPRPDELTLHRQFFRCPLKFEERRAAVVLRVEDLEVPVTNADERLCRYLDQLSAESLETLGQEGSFVDRVRRAIWSDLSGGNPCLAQAASTLGVSTRTLQRRLHEEGTTFASLLDVFRREMSARLLRDKSLAVYEVAFLLGYSDPSAFYRAFRRWRGASPYEFRTAAAG
jgi:AraC-like DNA-binding protein